MYETFHAICKAIFYGPAIAGMLYEVGFFVLAENFLDCQEADRVVDAGDEARGTKTPFDRIPHAAKMYRLMHVIAGLQLVWVVAGIFFTANWWVFTGWLVYQIIKALLVSNAVRETTAWVRGDAVLYLLLYIFVVANAYHWHLGLGLGDMLSWFV